MIALVEVTFGRVGPDRPMPKRGYVYKTSEQLDVGDVVQLQPNRRDPEPIGTVIATNVGVPDGWDEWELDWVRAVIERASEAVR